MSRYESYFHKKILELNQEIYFLQQYLKSLECRELEGCEKVDVEILRKTIEKKRKQLNKLEKENVW